MKKVAEMTDLTGVVQQLQQIAAAVLNRNGMR
jgi:hypothetical protein